jgi:beta-galactosidase
VGRRLQPHAAGWRGWAPWLEPCTALRALGLDVDVLPPGRDLRPYRLVVAPSLTIADDALVEDLRAVTAGGATLVIGPRSGAYRPDLRVHERPPGPLARLTGTRVARVDAFRPGTRGVLEAREPLATALAGEALGHHTWADLLEPAEGSAVWARYVTAAYPGQPALVCRDHGAGRCLTVGAALEAVAWGRLLGLLASEAGLSPLPLPDGVRLSRTAGRPCLQNFTDERVEVDLRALGGEVVGIGPVDVAWPELER